MRLYTLFQILHRIIPAETVYAHCDIPCGIYTVEPALTAAKTVLRMIEKLEQAKQDDHHAITRFTLTKEEHSQKCKQELLILWTDYFRQEHLQMFPQLHETFWKAAKLCSKNKQEVNRQAAQDLIKTVEEIREMFEKAEAAKKS